MIDFLKLLIEIRSSAKVCACIYMFVCVCVHIYIHGFVHMCIYMYMCIYLFIQPFAIFKWNKIDLNLDFSFSDTCCLTKAR